ncbi:MAG: YegP family protein [Pyrinomonadaceae bacterium]
MAGKFEIKSGKTGKFRFNLKSSNGQVILTSEAYESRSAAVKGITSVKNNAGNDKRFERKTAKDGSPFFVMKAANGEPIGKSEMYKTKSSMENGVASVGKHAPGAPVADAGNGKPAAKKAAKPRAKSAAKSAAKPAAKKGAAKPAAKKAAAKSAAKPAAKKAAAKKPAAKKPAAKKAAAKKPAAKKAARKKPAAKKK